MSDESPPGFRSDASPLAGGWASKQSRSPGATDTPASGATDTSRAPAAGEPQTSVPDCWASKQARSPGATPSANADAKATAHESAGSCNPRLACFGALLSAFIASSWCWLPPLLILGGISGAGMTTFLAAYRPYFMAATFAFLAAAFWFTYRPRGQTAAQGNTGGLTARIMAFNKLVLWVATAAAVALLLFPLFSSSVPADEGLTADMQRTVIQIEGMTWHTWVPKAKQALAAVPGVLAVTIDSRTGRAEVGTAQGADVPKQELLAALERIKYRGEIIDTPEAE